uniref:Uncharacterized protein n=1 Tax=Vespula pensylvanica TaxID=30213 RepID=A0A834K7L3_VESPE|nr:hypothetical protein H0235_015285 [Vespula pensylvanica]
MVGGALTGLRVAVRQIKALSSRSFILIQLSDVLTPVASGSYFRKVTGNLRSSLIVVTTRRCVPSLRSKVRRRGEGGVRHRWEYERDSASSSDSSGSGGGE